MIAVIAFWCCVAGVLYSYVVYPLLVWGLSALFGRTRVPPAVGGDDQLPTVSLLIAAYDEESVIAERIQNALALDYPVDKIEIVIASDGSSDRTNDIVRSFSDRRVRLLAYPERQGKAGVLNAAFREVRGDIVVLSDANTHTNAAAVKNLVRWFRNPDIGVVCGRLILTDPATGTNVDGLYWRYETFLKRCENRLGALLGANGAIYAIRRDLYTAIQRNTLIDDFVIPLRTHLQTGCVIEYDNEAVAYEDTPGAIGSEFKRRARIGTGGFQSMPALWALLNPSRGWIAFTYFSHKVCRWLCPFFLVGALITNLFLLTVPMYQTAFAAQIAIYGVAGLGTRLSHPGLPFKFLRLTTLFAGMNLALLVGFWRWVNEEPQGAWSRTARH
jgi:cellulose synthase/poly-beta-1,6-N-acetylglucosamine synthase-like glycosyltransferase